MNNSNKKRPSSSKPNTDRKKSVGGSKPALPKRAQNRKPVVKKDSPNIPKPIKSDEIRLNKYIANSGACSRRDADIYIQSGNVKVNGVAITEMGYKVKPGDVVNFDGDGLTPEKKEYILLNNPKNFTTSIEEVEHRNVSELIKGASASTLFPVGRMDKNTTGLLLFTNDTDVIRKFSLPNQKSSKIYQVSLDKNLKFEDLEKINKGLVLDGHRVYVEDVSYIEGEAKSEIGLQLRSANVKVLRSIFEHFNYDVL